MLLATSAAAQMDAARVKVELPMIFSAGAKAFADAHGM